MKANFKLSEKLMLFFKVACNNTHLTLGDRFPVSIRRSYTFSQSIYIYPESDYSFFTYNEVMCFMTLAQNLNLNSFVETENSVVVIKISDYSING